MSFGEFVFSARFIQKTVKGDLFVKVNYRILSRNRRGKTLEDSRRHITKAEPMSLTCWANQSHLEAARPVGPPCQPPVVMLVLHRLLGCIYVVLYVGLIQGLTLDAPTYISAFATLPGAILKP